MNIPSSKIKCPKCDEIIDVENILAHQLEEEIQRKYKAQYIEDQKKLTEKESQLKADQEAFKQSKEKEEEQFSDKLRSEVNKEKINIEKNLKAQLTSEYSEQVASMQKELNEKSEKVKNYNKALADIEKLKREKAEAKESAEVESQKKFTLQLEEERQKIKASEEQKNELKFKELQKQLEDQKKLAEEMQRKHEQGSMQLQGDVQETALEEWLQTAFPLDVIEAIKTGARGADCLQIVNTRTKQNCGLIYYESKRTKEFQNTWIEKFKSDIQERGADIGVLVTEALPNNMERMGIKDGIWICTFEEFKGLCIALRETLIKLSEAILIQENKGDKMIMLYDFLTSSEFGMQVSGIVEGFTQMQLDLESEKRAMQTIWKKREKQLGKILRNTTNMHGAIKGIGGSVIETIQLLELNGGEVSTSKTNLLEDPSSDLT